MSKLTLEPPSDSDATVAARHLCVLLATERPDLWPALNAASLGSGGGGVDWPDVLRQMEKSALQQRYQPNCPDRRIPELCDATVLSIKSITFRVTESRYGPIPT